MIKHIAVLKAPVHSFPFSATLAALTISGLLFAGLCGSALAAKPVGKDGKIHTCYKAKGKAKGSLRVVPAGKKCMKGWRKLAWTAAAGTGGTGASGAAGTGAQGSNGSGGGNGNNGNNGTDGSNEVAVLQTKVASMSLKLEGLEKVLGGLTNSDLTGAVNALDGVSGSELQGALDTLDGVTGAELNKALGAVPVLESACTQVSGLTGGIDSVNKGVKGLGVLGFAGLSLSGLSALPNNLLASYSCPAI
jgi:hypothetical protein